tara:strand:- start:289 stop:1209 length:921 start_codon:yes stop_codon:yes gene_type:complete
MFGCVVATPYFHKTCASTTDNTEHPRNKETLMKKHTLTFFVVLVTCSTALLLGPKANNVQAKPNNTAKAKAKSSGTITISKDLLAKLLKENIDSKQKAHRALQLAQKAIEEAKKPKVPVGSVMAYAGPKSSVPKGWLPCDGKERSRTKYEALYKVIGTTHGHGNKRTTFNVPDYRGYFLRGVDEGTGRDRYRSQRRAMQSGGNTKQNVGSVALDTTRAPRYAGFKADGKTGDGSPHTHQTHLFLGKGGPMAAQAGTGAFGDGPRQIGWYRGTQTGSHHKHKLKVRVFGGDDETSPKNAYVYFIIKY